MNKFEKKRTCNDLIFDYYKDEKEMIINMEKERKNREMLRIQNPWLLDMLDMIKSKADMAHETACEAYVKAQEAENNSNPMRPYEWKNKW